MKLLILVAVLSPNLLFAQAQEEDPVRQEKFAALHAQVMDLQKRHTITIRGSENPDALPRGEMLQLFFQRLSAEAPADDASFIEFASERFGASGSDSEVLKVVRGNVRTGEPKAVDVCLRVLDGSLADGPSIAEYVTGVVEQFDTDLEGHYQGIIDKLSPSVRTNLSQQVVTEEAPNAVNVTLDHLSMASEAPDLYKTMMMALCRGKNSAGSSPSATRMRR